MLLFCFVLFSCVSFFILYSFCTINIYIYIYNNFYIRSGSDIYVDIYFNMLFRFGLITRYQILAARSSIPRSWIPVPDLCYKILVARSWLPGILAARFWILVPGYQVLATRSRPSDPGYQILAARSLVPDPGCQFPDTWRPDPSCQILNTRPWLPDPGYRILAARAEATLAEATELAARC